MGWLLIVVAIVVLWIASLCKILLTSIPLSNTCLLNHGGLLSKKHVLLLLAHPDDESMFFSPTINYLISRGHNVHILCMSVGFLFNYERTTVGAWVFSSIYYDSLDVLSVKATNMASELQNMLLMQFELQSKEVPIMHPNNWGNADGLGNTRRDELYRACAILKVPIQQVKILDHPDLQDGFGQVWDHNLLAKIIEEEVSRYGIDLIITFDNYGVSGHCNHRDVHYGVCKLLHDCSQSIEAWELVSTNILRKYIGPVDIWFSMLRATKYTNGVMHCLLNKCPQMSFHAMAQHSSQWVWFRKLFISFSSYTYVNTLRKIN